MTTPDQPESNSPLPPPPGNDATEAVKGSQRPAAESPQPPETPQQPSGSKRWPMLTFLAFVAAGILVVVSVRACMHHQSPGYKISLDGHVRPLLGRCIAVSASMMICSCGAMVLVLGLVSSRWAVVPSTQRKHFPPL
jgi:hypothetical protein